MDQSDHAIAIFLRGLPGGGKSYIVKALAQALDKNKVVLLDPDLTDYQSKEYLDHVETMRAEGVEEQLYAYRFLRGKAYKAIEEGKIIIWDQPFRNLEIFHKMIGRFNDHAKEHNKKLSILVVEVDIDPVIAKQRVEERKQQGGHGPSDNTFTRFINEHKSFDDQGFNVVKVNGQDNVGKSVDTILKAVKSLYN